MSGDFGSALMLFIIGMVTVFSVLFLVVLLGNLLIRVVNLFHKDIPEKSLSNSQFISPIKTAVIVAAVEHATQGKGKVVSIKKI